MKVSYDSNIVQEAADLMYVEAENIIRSTMIRYGFGFFIVGMGIGIFMTAKLGISSATPFVVGIVFAFIGALMGKKAAYLKALELRLKAQTALCQVEIEKNSKAS